MASTLLLGVISPNKTVCSLPAYDVMITGRCPVVGFFKAWGTAKYQWNWGVRRLPGRYFAAPSGYPSAGCSPAEPASVSPNLGIQEMFTLKHFS